MSSENRPSSVLAKRLRVAAFVTITLIVESVVFALSALPGIFTFRLILQTTDPFFEQYLEPALIGLAFVPGYFVFCVTLMAATAAATKLLNWRATPGVMRIKDYSWTFLRWSGYNSAIHVVRIFAGGLFRATPVWSWFVRLNGAKVGKRVHINSLGVYDHNLISFGDDTVVGSDVKLSAHIGEGGRVYVAPVSLGRGVTLGTNSIVHPGVVIGDHTSVGALSLVPRDAVLAPNAVYGGVPVHLIRQQAAPGDGNGAAREATLKESTSLRPVG